MISQYMQKTWSWLELFLDGHAKLMVQLLLVRVARAVGNPFRDLLSFARMIAFSAAPAGACIHWVLPRTVDSWDLKCDIFNANTEVEKDFMRLVIVAFEAA